MCKIDSINLSKWGFCQQLKREIQKIYLPTSLSNGARKFAEFQLAASATFNFVADSFKFMAIFPYSTPSQINLISFCFQISSKMWKLLPTWVVYNFCYLKKERKKKMIQQIYLNCIRNYLKPCICVERIPWQYGPTIQSCASHLNATLL